MSLTTILLVRNFDANNLYGWGVSQLLPTGQFAGWLIDQEITTSKFISILKVDLHYPSELHDLHYTL